MDNIEKLGFDKWFQDKVETTKLNEFQIARVISVNRNSFVVSNGDNDIYAELTGKFLFNSDLSTDFPTIDLCCLLQYYAAYVYSNLANQACSR